MKKLISAVVAAALTVSAAVPVFAKDTFSDVTPTTEYKWAYSYVESMAEKGLIKGYEDGTFKPAERISRRDGFALFSRLTGSNSEVNDVFLKQAKEKYKNVLSKYNLSYAEGDVAYLLSKELISESELDTYFAGTKAVDPMPRYEAAILITKVMLGERAAKKEVMVDLDYSDVPEIPKNARQYVYYVTKKGIMAGMGDNSFDPNGSVTRAQMAVMLSKTSDCTEYTFDKVTVISVDESSRNINIKDLGGSNYIVGYDDDARFFRNGELTVASGLIGGQTTVLSCISDGDDRKLAFGDTIGANVDDTKSVIFRSYKSVSGELKLTVAEPSTDTLQTYDLDDSAVVTLDGVPSDLNKLTLGDYITIGFEDGRVVKIDAMKKSAKIDAVIEDIGSLGTLTISTNDDFFNGMTLSLSKDVKIVKNGERESFSELGRGDKVKLDIEYGIITNIVATSSVKTVTGVLTEYTVSSSPKITINRDGTSYIYDLAPDAEITLNGEKAILAQFSIGNSVTVTVESEVAKKIVATGTEAGASADSQVSGTVTGMYDKTILIQNTDNGGDVTISVYCTDLTTVLKVPQLTDYRLKDIKIGDTIVAYGTYSTGIFVSSGIMVTPAKD